MAAATKGDSLHIPAIDHTIFSKNIITLNHYITTNNNKIYLH